MMKLLLLLVGISAAATLTVTPTGPTLRDVAAQAQPGDVIEYAAGVYNSTQSAPGLRGSELMPITVRPAAGASVVFDGSAADPMFWLDDWQWVVFDGENRVEIRNTKQLKAGGGHGLSLVNASHVTLRRLHLHHTFANCLWAGGRFVTIRDNWLHDCVQMNFGGNSTSWGQSLGTTKYGMNAGGLSEGILVENNTVTESWGEGIDLLYCDGCTARGNTVRNAFSVMLYTDNSRNCILERNLVLSTDTRFDRFSGQAAPAWLVGTETHGTIDAVNLTFRDNVCLRTSGISFFGPRGYYSQVHVVHNTFFGMYGGVNIRFSACVDAGMTEGNECSNNAFYVISKYWNAEIDEIDAWTVFNNVWLGIDAVPLLDTTGFNTSAAVPGLNATLLFNQDGTCTLDPHCFRPLCQGGALRLKGARSAYSSTADFFGEYRSKSAPSIGAIEMCIEPASGGDDGSGDGDSIGSGFKVRPFAAALLFALLLVL